MTIGKFIESNEARRCVAEMKVAQQEFADLLDGIFGDLDQLCTGLLQYDVASTALPQTNANRSDAPHPNTG